MDDAHDLAGACKALDDPFRPDTIDALAKRLAIKWRRIAGRKGFPFALLEDATNDAWVRMLMKRHTLHDVSRFDAWANTIFINCMFDLLHAHVIERRTRSLDSDASKADASSNPVHTPEPADLEGTPEGRVLRREQAAKAVAALAALTGREREVLERFDRNGEPAADVAALLGITPGRVRHIAMSARRQLWDAVCQGQRRPVLRDETAKPGRRRAPKRTRGEIMTTGPVTTMPPPALTE